MKRTGTPRLVDVAEAAGVSLASASRAMSGGSGISPEVAAHVRRVAQELGYEPNLHARGLAGGLVPTIGLLVHEIGDPYFSEIASGVIRSATLENRSVQIAQADRTPESELAQVQALLRQRVGSIIIAGSGYADPEHEQKMTAALAEFALAGGRAAVIGRHYLPIDAVLPDNHRAGVSVGAHLAALGHRRIGVVAGPLELNTVADRIAGLREGIADAEVELTVVSKEFTREGGIAGARELVDGEFRGRDLTAIVGLNDAMAIGILSELRQQGIRVPDDLSVVGFDDIAVAADVAPALTTARIPMFEMGQHAVALILRPASDEARTVSTSHELIVRASTAPPRG
ncbi:MULTISPECIES: LacI family DNA-binding transcriptional regulator [Microbacterium]|uniref:LacI family transcriptional regulator n=1 Tax=Microbacterium galbinum TaxID=2851646 RepID=A0ABY4ILG8_9MICO|nr:LacI family DNA-binding transcriptional regulator [Microbacterium galbinum]MCK2023988.1 LacI family transcriptional regulator [Microbacterium galbinum]UPL13607.1 LacI family transcriptional regulator [Microbacterium galbinum]